MPKETITYEQSLAELEQIVRRMEGGELTLDELTASLARAQRLLRLCSDRLTKTDAEIQKMLAPDKPAQGGS